MSEFYGSYYDPEAAEMGVRATLTEIRRQVNHPPNNDEYVAAMWKGFLEVEETSMSLKSLLRLFANSRYIVPAVTKDRPGMGRSEAAGIIRANYQASMLELSESLPEGERYPLGRNDPAVCARDFEDILSDETRYATFMTNLIRKDRKVQTNRASRYGPVELIGQLYGKSSLLDVACGIMQGPYQLWLKDQYPFSMVHMRSGETVRSPEDTELSYKANALLRRSSAFHTFFATDIVSPYDKGTHVWSKASVRPMEMLNKTFMQKQEALAQAALEDRRNPTPRVAFFEGDFGSDEEMEPLMAALHGEKLDVAVLATFLHQIADPPQRQAMIDRARSMLKDDGILVIQDFIYERKNSLILHTDWRPGTYRTFILHMDDPSQTYQEFMVALDLSSCIEMRPGKGKLYLNGEYIPVEAALRQASVD